MNKIWLRRLSLGLLALTLVACATSVVTGRRQFMIVSEDSAIAASQQAYAQQVNELSDAGKLSTDKALINHIERITGKLVAQAIKYRPETAQWQWSVAVINDPETVNAYCMAGGRMAIYTGLVQKLNATDDEIAQVMGHEIAHALAAHTAEKMSTHLVVNGLVLGTAVATEMDNRSVIGAAALANVALALPNSRQMEADADRIGIEIAAKAGFDPQAAVTLWQKMAKESGDNGFEFLSTHPAPERRQKELQKLVPQMMPYYQDQSPRPTFPLKTVHNV